MLSDCDLEHSLLHQAPNIMLGTAVSCGVSSVLSLCCNSAAACIISSTPVSKADHEVMLRQAMHRHTSICELPVAHIARNVWVVPVLLLQDSSVFNR